MLETVVIGVRRLNDGAAVLTGVALLGTVVFILAEIIIRQLGSSLGGTDEISGYVMAGTTSWGMSYALSTLTHVRIDLARLRLKPIGQAMLDILAMIALTGVALVIAVQTWPVLSKTLESGARANTPLETPLWIPQVIWWSGWIWFAFTSSVLLICAIILLLRRELTKVDGVIGMGASEETPL